jgi:hypothetical protein
MHARIRTIFLHRRNGDGIYDSICTVCFVKVATNEDEAKLRYYELAHVCNPLQFQWVSRIPRYLRPRVIAPNRDRKENAPDRSAPIRRIYLIRPPTRRAPNP